MKKQPDKAKLHITFHNPNTPDETEKHLIHLLAQAVADKAFTCPQEPAKTPHDFENAS